MNITMVLIHPGLDGTTPENQTLPRGKMSSSSHPTSLKSVIISQLSDSNFLPTRKTFHFSHNSTVFLEKKTVPWKGYRSPLLHIPSAMKN
jgi:hypothetical protein